MRHRFQGGGGAQRRRGPCHGPSAISQRSSLMIPSLCFAMLLHHESTIYYVFNGVQRSASLRSTRKCTDAFERQRRRGRSLIRGRDERFINSKFVCCQNLSKVKTCMDY